MACRSSSWNFRLSTGRFSPWLTMPATDSLASFTSTAVYELVVALSRCQWGRHLADDPVVTEEADLHSVRRSFSSVTSTVRVAEGQSHPCTRCSPSSPHGARQVYRAGLSARAVELQRVCEEVQVAHVRRSESLLYLLSPVKPERLVLHVALTGSGSVKVGRRMSKHIAIYLVHGIPRRADVAARPSFVNGFAVLGGVSVARWVSAGRVHGRRLRSVPCPAGPVQKSPIRLSPSRCPPQLYQALSISSVVSCCLCAGSPLAVVPPALHAQFQNR